MTNSFPSQELNEVSNVFFSNIKTYKMRIIHNFALTVLNMKEKPLIHLLGRELIVIKNESQS